MPARALMAQLARPGQDVPPRTARLESAISAFLVYGAFEGLLKRLTRYAWYVYPIKDLFLLVVVIAWIQSLRGAKARPPFAAVLTAYLTVAVAQVFNPYVPSVVAGFTGLRSDYAFAALFFFTFQGIRNEVQVCRLARVIGGIAVVTAIGAVIESLLGLEWVYDNRLQVAINANYYGVSGDLVLRPSSVGNGPGSAAMMEFIGTGFLLGLGALERRTGRRILYLLGAGAAMTGILLAATRVIWLMTAIAAGVFVLLVGRRKTIWAMAVGGIVTLAVFLSVFFSSGEIVARFETLETPFETYRTERYGSLAALPRIVDTYPAGAGVGWNVPRKLDVLADFYGGEAILFLGVHNYLSILALETSLAGLTLFVAFALGVLGSGLMAILRERNQARRTLFVACYAIFAGIALSFPFGGALIGWPGEYYWILGAIVVRLIVRGKAERRVAAISRLGPVSRLDPGVRAPGLVRGRRPERA